MLFTKNNISIIDCILIGIFIFNNSITTATSLMCLSSLSGSIDSRILNREVS